MTVERRRLGRTELEVPALTYGGGWIGGFIIRAEKEAREALLSRALAAGIDWIDTAALYGQGVSETVIGAWLAGLAPDARPRLSTKFNVDLEAGDITDQILRSVEASFERLGVEHVPLIYLHNQILGDGAERRDARSIRVGELMTPGGVADAMETLRERGLCDWLGITALGDPAALHGAVDSGRFDAAQVYVNLLNPTALEQPTGAGGAGWNTSDFAGLLGRCAAQDMGVMGIRIFAGGHLAATERHGREIPVTDNTDNSAEEARAAALFEVLGDGYGNRAQTALRFGLGLDRVSTLVIGIGEPGHLDVALAAAAMGPLPESRLEALEDLWRSHPAFRTASAV